MTDVEQFKPGVSIEALDDDELLMVHAEAHSYYKEYDEMGREVEGWSKDSLVEVHGEIRRELEARGLPHPKLSSLDDIHVQPVQVESRYPHCRAEILHKLGDKFITKSELRQAVDSPEVLFETTLDKLVEEGKVEDVGFDYIRQVPSREVEAAGLEAPVWDAIDLEDNR